MSARRRRTDRNQAEIIAALRGAGATVVDLSATGGGVPDLLVGRGRVTFLLEVKRPERSANESRPATVARQQRFRDTWRGGPVRVVRSVDEALAVVLGLTLRSP